MLGNNLKTLLFSNTSAGQTVFKNTFWLGVSDVFSKLLRLVFLIYVARILGATAYGEFSFAFAFVYFFAVLADLGVGEIIVREFSGDSKKEKDFSNIFSLKIFLNLFTFLLVFLVSFLITQSLEIQKIIWILGVYLFLDSFFFLFCSFLRSRQEMQYEALAKIFQSVVLIGIGFFMLFTFPSVKGLSYSYVFSVLSALIFILAIFLFKKNTLKIKLEAGVWKRYLSLSWPLAFTSVLMMIYNQIDSVMLGYWGQFAETGWYNAAYRIVGATLAVNGLIATAFYPALSKYFKESKDKLQILWNYHMEIMIFLAIPFTIIGLKFSRPIIDTIYGLSFSPSILAFQILIIMAAIAYIQTPFNHILIAANQQKKLFLATAFGAVINVILNLILIPKFSLYGAAVATVATFFTLLVSCAYFTHVFTPVKIWSFKPLIIKNICKKIKI